MSIVRGLSQTKALYFGGFRFRPVIERKPPGLPRSVRTPQNVESLRTTVLTSSGSSDRRQTLTLGMSTRQYVATYTTICDFICIIIVQQLLDANAVVIMSDETDFDFKGTVNKQNCRYWAAGNPRELHQKLLHSSKMIV